MRGTLENSAKIIPARHAFPVTPDDNADLVRPARGVTLERMVICEFVCSVVKT